MRPFLKNLIDCPFFNLRDVALFHLLPEVPYFAGVYEISYNGFSKMARVDRKTVKSFFDKLEKTGFITMLRNGNNRGKNCTVAFVRNELSLHNKNYNGKILNLPGTQSLLYPSFQKFNIPLSFFKCPPKQSILLELQKLLSDPTLSNETVKQILNDRILCENKNAVLRRKNNFSNVG